jgi:hypothetical protein
MRISIRHPFFKQLRQMKYQIAFYYLSDHLHLIHLKTIPAKDYGEAFSAFYDQFEEWQRGDLFILEINMETEI